jgi:putative transposase
MQEAVATPAQEAPDLLASSERIDRPTFDDVVMFDLKPDEIVLIDDQCHRFIRKILRGPYIFWNGDTNAAVPYSTIDLLKFTAQGKYYHPGSSASPSFDPGKWTEIELNKIRLAYLAFRERPRKKAEAKWAYVAEFIVRMEEHRGKGLKYKQNHDNALEVVKEVDRQIDLENESIADPRQKRSKPKCRKPRTVLRWVARQLALGMNEALLLHGSATKPKKRSIHPKALFLIAQTIRELVNISAKLGPKKIQMETNGKIKAHNLEHKTEIPEVKIGVVQYEYRRYDAWIRMAKSEGRAKADLEYGCVGKYERPERILDEVELDHHLVDVHALLGKSPLGVAFVKAGIDRFWVTIAFDVHSGYPTGFYPSFEVGNLSAALMCLDHAIRPKPYVAERWPDINGVYLSVGKPVKVRFDNAKAHVKIQMRRALARIGISFELSVPHHPETKPFVERFNGTFESDLIHWLKGSTGSNPDDKGDRKPQLEATITLDDLMELIHQWLIEVYCRRPQRDLDNETPEERWVRGANSPSHRPRVLDATQQAKWDLIPSLELDLVATGNGIRWNNLEFNSLELQRLRRKAGYHGHREMKPTPIKAWVPLYDVGTMKVALSTAIESSEREPKSEITLKSSNPLAHGRKKWEHDVICAFVRSQAKSPKDHASYEDGFRRLFANALSKMGLVRDGEKPAKSIKLTGGQAPRFLGVLDRGAARPALEKTDETMVMFGMFSNLDAHLTKTHDGRTPQSQNAAGDAADAEATQTYDFPVDPILDFIPE